MNGKEKRRRSRSERKSEAKSDVQPRFITNEINPLPNMKVLPQSRKNTRFGTAKLQENIVQRTAARKPFLALYLQD